MEISHPQIESLLREVSEEVILPGRRNLTKHEIEHKSPGEVVTQIDRDAEVFLSKQLVNILPNSYAVGEEGVQEDPSSEKALYSSNAVWVIDPIDGTRNFVSGNGPFSTLICLLRNGETLAAWIYDPIKNLMTCAEKGAGIHQNGIRLVKAKFGKPVTEMDGALRTKFLPEDLKPDAEKAANRFRSINRSMSAGYDYPTFASDELDFLFYYRTFVWDHAPGVLIAQEAGGIVKRLDGSAYSPIDRKKGLLCASNCLTWTSIQSEIVPSIKLVPSRS